MFWQPYSKLSSWDYTSNYLTENNHCQWPVIKLCKIAAFRFEPAEEAEIKSGRVALLDKISFEEGAIHYSCRANTKMAQYKAYKGDIVVSKINARKGAVGLVESELPIGATVHFRVLAPDASRVNAKYLKLALRSSFCRNQFEILTGGQGKGEISEERLKQVEVPFPPLAIQNKIVRHWELAQEEKRRGQLAHSSLVEELNQYLLRHTAGFEQAVTSKHSTVSFSAFAQWDLKAGRAAAFKAANPGFVRLGEFTEECKELVHPGEAPEKEWPVYGVNNKEGVFLNSYQKGAEFNAPYKKIKKDWFFHNPTRANVGSLGIVPQVPSDALTSPEYQVWRLKGGGFTPEFMALLLKTPYFLAVVAFNRVGAVKQRMYYANLCEICLPLVPGEIQKSFAERHGKILADMASSKGKMKEQGALVEQMILGILPVA